MKYLTQNKWWEINKEYNVDKLLYLLIDRPNKINRLNDFIWKNDKDQNHRDYDLPACSSNVYNLFWHKNDHLQRENKKPANIFFDGRKIYWENEKFIKIEKI